MLIGLPSLRLRADYFAIATIAAAEAIRYIAANAQGLTGGTNGIFGFADSWDDVSDSIEEFIVDLGWTEVPNIFPLFLVTWATALILMVGLWRAQNTPWGRVLRAVREDEDAARALGHQRLLLQAAVAVDRRGGGGNRRLLPRPQPQVRDPG